MGADAQLRDHDLDLGVLRPALPVDLLGAAEDEPWDIIVGAIVDRAARRLNIVGIQEAAKLNITLAFLDFATQLLLVLLGFYLIFSPSILVDNIHWGTAPTWSNFALAIPVAMIAYTGIETASNLAEEARDPGAQRAARIPDDRDRRLRDLLTLPGIALSALPVKHVDGRVADRAGAAAGPGRLQERPRARLVENLGLSGAPLDALKVYVGMLAATILFIATNAGVIGASRITYAMATYRQLPEVFRRVHPRFRTPWVSLVFFARDLSTLTLMPGQVDFLGTMYSFGAMLSFTIAHLSLIALRAKKPDEELVFRGRPNVRFRGIDWPIFAFLGGLATGLAWLVSSSRPRRPATRGSAGSRSGSPCTSCTGGASSMRA